MGLREIESTLPPGFRFHPSDDELVCHYLYKKVTNVKVYEGTMIEVDLHTREPWELPEGAKLSDNEWYFFSFRDRKYATGMRTNRATKTGYWKATGKDRTIYHPKTNGIFGMRKTLVFYSGRAPNGIKTAWVMHEFRLENPHTLPKEDWVLCRVFHKRKAETSNSNEQDHKLGCSPSSQLVSSPPLVNQSVQDGCQQLMGGPYHLNLAALHYNFFDFPQELDSTSMMGVEMMGMGSSKDTINGGDDDYGFLLDVTDHFDDARDMGIKGNIGNVEDI